MKQPWSNAFNFFTSFSITKWFVLFETILLLRLDSLLSKSFFVIKFACATLALNRSAANLLNSGVVIYIYHEYDQ